MDAGPGNAVDKDIEMMVLLGFYALVIVVFLAVHILFLLTLSKALKRCAPVNRRMEPGEVWYGLIPCFNLYWNFQIADRVPESLRREFRDRGLRYDYDCGGKAAYNWALMGVLGLIPCVNYITPIIQLVYFLIFWVKVAGVSKELAEGPSFRQERDEYDDDFHGDDQRFPDRPPGPLPDDWDAPPDDKPWRRR